MKTTKEQRRAMHNVYLSHFYPLGPSYRQFRRTVKQGFDCLMAPIPAADGQSIYMWLGIETDGYTHS